MTEQTTSFSTADLCDSFPDLVHAATPGVRDFGGIHTFMGEIATVQVWEDNVLMRQALEQGGSGRVLVVDGGSSVNCALMGDKVAQLAYDNQWAGIIMSGCVRDSTALATIPLGIRALGTSPVASKKKGLGHTGITLHLFGISFHPGHFVYADADGVIVAPRNLLER
jgi:regulator of ribonuclease activity A